MRKVNLIPVLFVVLFLLLLDLYVFQGVKTLYRDFDNVSIYAIGCIYWLASIVLIGSMLNQLRQSLLKGKVSRFSRNAFNISVTIFVTKLSFAIVLFTEDGFRLVAGLIREIPIERSRGVSQLALIVAAIPFFSFLYGVTRGKYNYKVHQLTLDFDDLPDAFDGFKLVQISDVHAGSFDNPEAVKRGVDLINKQSPDLVVFTGDLVNNRADEIEPWVHLFSTINAPFGKFSVLGNHDYGDYVQWPSPGQKVENLLKLKEYQVKMGFRLLLDEHVVLQKGSQQITLAGVENWGLGFGQRGDLEKALSGADSGGFKILLSHDPTHWQSVVKVHRVKVNLTLSGHTHGMQFGIEALGIKWSPVKYRYPHWAGLAQHRDRFLYINRGFGFLGFSGRVGIWPEITVITLKSKQKPVKIA